MKLNIKTTEIEYTFKWFTLYRYLTNDLKPSSNDILKKLYINKLFIYNR
jgi:hypothetical protein